MMVSVSIGAPRSATRRSFRTAPATTDPGTPNRPFRLPPAHLIEREPITDFVQRRNLHQGRCEQRHGLQKGGRQTRILQPIPT
jgi:hypothetical protein